MTPLRAPPPAWTTLGALALLGGCAQRGVTVEEPLPYDADGDGTCIVDAPPVVDGRYQLCPTGCRRVIWLDGIELLGDRDQADLRGDDNTCLVQLGASLLVHDLTHQETLTGLEAVIATVGHVFVEETKALTDLDGLAGLQLVGADLNLASNEALTSADGLSALELVRGRIRIHANPGLSRLPSLPNLGLVGTAFEISGNSGLQSLEGLEGPLWSPPPEVRVLRNRSLASLEGLDRLAGAGPVSLEVTGNALPDLLSFPAGVAVAELVLSERLLRSMRGMEGVQSLSGDLMLGGCTALETLSGLEGLRRIGGDLRISHNPSLTDISALEGLEWVGGEVKITGNDALSSEAIDALYAAIDAIGGEG